MCFLAFGEPERDSKGAGGHTESSWGRGVLWFIEIGILTFPCRIEEKKNPTLSSFASHFSFSFS